jgi:primosomal protein N'
MNRNHNLCKNKDSDCCVLFSSCNDCYYYEEGLICHNCGRNVPYKKFINKNGCEWCIPKKKTKYCNGKY